MVKTLLLIPSPFEFESLFTSVRDISSLEESGIYPRICGIGPAAAAFMTGHHINQIHPDHVLLVGIAGAFKQGSLKLRDVVTVSHEVYADLGYSENGLPVCFDQINLPLLTAADDSPLTCSYNLKPVQAFQSANSITVSTVTSDHNRAEYLFHTHQAELENMEGAAVALACQYHGISLSEIRSISNFIGPRDKDAWETKPALESLKSGLSAYFTRLSKKWRIT